MRDFKITGLNGEDMFVHCIRYRAGVCSRIRGNPVVHETVISLCEIIYRQISDRECIECSMQAADNNGAQIPLAAVSDWLMAAL